jgi:hypothetical protein
VITISRQAPQQGRRDMSNNMKMKRWAFLTIALYVVTLVVLYTPIALFVFPRADDKMSFLGDLCLYVLPVMALFQTVLLLVPVAVAKERPVKRRSIVVSAAFGAVPMSMLVMGFVVSLMLIIWPEDSPVTASVGGHLLGWLGWLLLGGLWLFWGIVFYRSFSSNDPRRFTSKVTAWLLRGSILEMLVAIPCHIISRQRNECCAPALSLLGIVMGLSVSLLAFGPSLFFLFAKRIQDKTQRQISK